MPFPQRKQNVSLTLEQKLDICDLIKEKHKSRKEIGNLYQCDVSTIAKLLKNEEHLRKAFEENTDLKKKRLRKRNQENVEKPLKTSFPKVRCQSQRKQTVSFRCQPQRKQNVSLTLEQKLEICDLIKEKHNTRKEIGDLYQCDVSTIAKLLKNEEHLRKAFEDNMNLNMKRLRKGKYEIIDDALYLWFQQMKHKDVVLNGPTLMKQAKLFSSKLKLDFDPSSGWYERWKKRNNVMLKNLPDEINPNYAFLQNDTMRLHATLEILDRFEPNDIFNADETSFLYKALPNRNNNSYEPSIHINKKERLTILFITNMTGSDRQAHIIGKFKEPSCFKGKSIPLPYYSNCKGWMTTKIWITILKDLDKTMVDQNRKIVLFIDNADCHKLDIDSLFLNNIELIYMQSKSKTPIQPLRAGLIRVFKAYYRQNIIKKQLFALDRDITNEDFLKSIDLYKGILMIREALWSISHSIIKNAFRKCGFIRSNKRFNIKNEKITDGNNAEEEPDMSISEILFIKSEISDENPLNIREEQNIDIEKFNQQMNNDDEDIVIDNNEILEIPEISEQIFRAFLDIDSNLKCYGDLNDDEILMQCQNEDGLIEIEKNNTNDNINENTVSNDDNEKRLNENRIITKKEVLLSIDTLRSFLKQNNADMTFLNVLEEQILETTSANTKMVKLYLNKL